ncbi:sucrase ferredoxin [Streptomyces sp. N2-109]|uniref:Sucrase ferredoxin n=1 Tax=Streptomyces gossypii TaxID=2883101 RepID=A0ABT2JRV6_9ACTN|nr:sucrase ferredoxin [Streptomyces gossypii]MCT2590625.1 sucrase ferredoxin [Streptomyces gossypii]
MSTCAITSEAMGEPLAATAATARTWLLIEQPGPWGPKALTGSHLDPELGSALDRLASPHGTRVALIRRPGPHPDRHGPLRRRVFLAHTLPGRSWLLGGVLTGPPEEQLRELDFAALGSGDLDGLPDTWQPHEGDPLVLVCTNGRRDRCCALLGRPLAAELAASGTADIWEITHLGGHRFAPTLLVLPYGYAYGRIGAPAVKGVLEALRDGRVLTERCRGRSAWDRPGQAADLAVRARTGEQHADALSVLGTEETGEGRWQVTVAHADGSRWRVRIDAASAPAPHPASCGAAPGTPDRMRVVHIELLGDEERDARGAPV